MEIIQHDFDIEAVLAKPLMAHLSSYCPEGPRDSPVWFLWEDSKIWLFGTGGDSFVERLTNDPRCAVGIVDFMLENGVLQHIGFRGEARKHDICLKKRDHFVSKYLGNKKSCWNPWFKQNVVNPLDIMFEINPLSMVAKDVSFFKTGPELASKGFACV